MGRAGKGTPNLHVCALGDPGPLALFLSEQPGVSAVRTTEEGVFLHLEGGSSERAALLAAIVGQGLAVHSFSELRSDLEDLFLSMTEGDVQ